MLQAQHMIGLPVLDVETGKVIASCRDVLLRSDWSAVGILLDAKRWFSAPRWVPWDSLLHIGEDAITIPNQDVVEKWDEETEKEILTSEKLKGLPVLTINGHQLGSIEDVYFSNISDKHIIGFELSDGFLTDIQEGRSWLPLANHPKLGEDAVIVPSASEQHVEKIVTLQ